MSVVIAAARLATAARLAVVVAASWCAVWAAPAAAAGSRSSARAAPAGSVVLSGSFRPVGVAGRDFLASGEYVLLSSAVNDGQNPGWIVINDRLGTTTALDPQCQVTAIGPPWALLSCPPPSNPSGAYDVELYSLTQGTRQTVTPSPGMPPQCPQVPFGTQCTSAAGVGIYWIRWEATCYHCTVTSFFQNIQTGELRKDPTNATTFADLNSVILAHTTCPGVRLMPQPSYLTPWGSLTYDGQFALVSSASSVFLERCGTHMRRLIGGQSRASYALTSNAGAIVWQAVTSKLTGLFLPSLQNFTIPLPSVIVKPPGSPEDVPVLGLALTSRALFVRDGWVGRVFRTAAPNTLPLNTTRPKLTRRGNTLTCRRGSWHNARRFSYMWLVNGLARKGARYTLAVGQNHRPRSVICNVTASNAAGMTTASTAPVHLR